MRRPLLGSTMFARPVAAQPAAIASNLCAPDAGPPDGLSIGMLVEAKRLLQEADDDADTWPREGWFEGRRGQFHRTWGGLEFTPYSTTPTTKEKTP